MPNLTTGEFPVIMVGVSVTARVILRHWKTPKTPELKEWVIVMTKTASYKPLLYKLHNKNKAGVLVGIPVWEDFWSVVSLSLQVTQSFFIFLFLVRLFTYLLSP